MCSAKLWLIKHPFITVLFSRHSQPELALPKMMSGKAISKGTLGRSREVWPENRRLAWSLNELAVFYHDTGRLSEAEPLYRRELAIQEKGVGQDHPDSCCHPPLEGFSGDPRMNDQTILSRER